MSFTRWKSNPVYGPLLQAVWKTAQAGTIELVSSDLVLMEVLVAPLKNGDAALQRAYEVALLQTDVRLLPITQDILREAARLRATTRLKTPDAIHAATASGAGCALLVTNDPAFRTAAGVPVVILDDLLTP